MKRLMKFLLGLTVGAAVATLLAPKSGRELRQQLIGGATGKSLPAVPEAYPQTAAEPSWGSGVAAAVAEPVVEEPIIEEAVVTEETVSVSDAGVVTDTVVIADTTTWAAEEDAEPAAEETPTAEETLIEEEEAPGAEEAVPGPEAVAAQEIAEPALEPIAGLAAEEAAGAGDDLRTRIEETRAAVEGDIAEPFAGVAAETTAADEELVTTAAVAPEPALPVEQAPEPAEFEGPEYQAPVVAPPEAEEPVVEEAPVAAPHGWDIPYEPEEPHNEAPAAEAPAADDVAVEKPTPTELEAEATVTGGAIVEAGPEAAPDLVADIGAVEAAPVVEAEPVVEAAPLVEAEPVVEAAPVIEAESGPPAEAVVEEVPVAREATGSIDQAEMRRRIEETRARLKAKAFDAMMSGEAALLSRDSGDKPVPKADDIKLDDEVESTIDESLSQEEL